MDAAARGRNLIDWESGALREKRHLIIDRDTQYTEQFRRLVCESGTEVIRLLPMSPNLNSICERVIETIRRECLDWLIPMSESHLRAILKEWARHYNFGRPHKSLGPGVPDPPHRAMTIMKSGSRHRLGDGVVVLANSVLGGLHHEYSLATAPAAA